MKTFARLWGAAFLIASTHCGAESSEPQTKVALRGTIAYEGAFEGTLEISVFDAFPPRGGPVTRVRLESPQFPVEYAFDQLRPGRYFVLAMLDQNPNDGAQFHPTVDPGGAHGSFTSPVSIQVGSVGTTEHVDIQLVDPDPSSPWVRRNYR